MFVIDMARLPPGFPTHRHPDEFWTALGKAVATFGFLEEVLGKAIFAFTSTRPYSSEEIDAAYAAWIPTLATMLSDQLGGLIDRYEKAVRNHPDTTLDNLSDLVDDLRKAALVRNVLCHGSWREPDRGQSLPLFVNRRSEIFNTPIDTAYLHMVQQHGAELACAVMNSVTHMGWQFPGSDGPGTPLLGRDLPVGVGGTGKGIGIAIERRSPDDA